MTKVVEKDEGSYVIGNGSGKFRAKEGQAPWTDNLKEAERFLGPVALKTATDRHRYAQLHSLKGTTEIFIEVGDDQLELVMSFKA